MVIDTKSWEICDKLVRNLVAMEHFNGFWSLGMYFVTSSSNHLMTALILLSPPIPFLCIMGYTYSGAAIFYCCSIPGPFGERDEEQVFIQRIIPETDKIFVRFCSTGKR